MNEIEAKNRTGRLKILLRLILPMFLVSYPLALIFSFPFSPYPLLEAALGLFSGILIGIIWEVTMNRPVGILGGMWFGIWLGMSATISWFSWIAILFTTISGVTLGAGVINNTKNTSSERILKNKKRLIDLFDEYNFEKKKDLFPPLRLYEISRNILGFSVIYFAGGYSLDFNWGIVSKVGKFFERYIIVIGILFIITAIITNIIPSWGVAASISWSITMGSVAGILAGVAQSQARTEFADLGIGMGSGIVIGDMLGDLSNLTEPSNIVIAIIPAIAAAMAWGITIWLIYKETDGVRGTRKIDFSILLVGIVWGVVIGPLIGGGAWCITLFLLCYVISYFQLPILLMNFISINIVRKAISNDEYYEDETLDIFVLLHASSLYWDQWEVLQMPHLKQFYPAALCLDKMMELATEQDIERTAEILTFIETERPFLLPEVQLGVRKVFWQLLGDIEKPEDIAELIPEDVTEWTQYFIQYFTDLKILAVKLNVFASPSWLEFIEKIVDIVAELNIEQAIEIVTLIKPEQPHHKFAVYQEGLRVGFLQLIAHAMKSQKTLRDISETTQPFAQLQALSTKLDISDLDELFVLLNGVCLDAVHYRSSLGWQVRHDALQGIITNLRSVETLINSSWTNVVNRWKATAQYELDKLQQEPRKTDQINNPYVVGQALQPGTSLFVGRQDLVQQLELGLGRGSHRPTFFLNGERRMGKSSTLRQLPYLLNTRHFLPIFFDMQAPELTSSAAAFLSSIAEKMSETIENAGLQIETLVNKRLREAQKENEATVYYVFNEWLKQAERVLEQNNRIVLLSFDEFENLEMVGKAKYLDLHLLLNWFRSVIQNRPQLALLFSGGKSVSEIGQGMDLNWSSYFVNVQTFRVSFLHEVEARHLITRPIPDYPIEQIFGLGVVNEIIRVTSCHPFLVQAICSNLINNLNVDGRERAEIYDVTVAVTQVLENWEDTYFQDLWRRTDPKQRACLIALNDLGKGNIQKITQHVYGDREIDREKLHSIRHSIQILLKRDLVLIKEEDYQIATPIFCQWIERNS